MRLSTTSVVFIFVVGVAVSGQSAHGLENHCGGSGSLTLERWDEITIEDPSQIPFSKAPNSSKTVTLAEAPSDIRDNYAQRMRGYVCAPVSGDYTFFIAGDNQVKLYVSTDTNPANKNLLASHNGWTHPREWNKYSTQKSAPVMLVGGKQYYIEAIHVEQGGGDNLAVGWLLPSGVQEAPIPGTRLSTTVAPSPGPIVSANLVLNSGFESGATSWQDWGSSRVVSSNARSGSYALRVGTGTGGRAQPINLAPVAGKSFTFKASGKVSVAGEKGWAGVHFMKGGQQQTQSPHVEFTSTSYADKSVTFTVPAGIEALRVWAWKNSGGGHLYVDDYSIVENSSTLPPSPTPTVTPTSSPVASCSGKGSLLLQRWDGINLTDPELIPVSQAPSASSNVSIAEAPTDIRDSYGNRLSGTICAPVTGDYQFYVSGDDQTSLYLSTDSSAANRKRIAYHTAWTNPREFEKYATQKSALIRLEAGKQYYIEARQVEQGGGDNLAIGWKLPDGTLERPIPGTRLSPASGMAPSPTPTATATSLPSPTPTQTYTGENPSPPVPAPNVAYSGPLVITKGGTYTGNWQSTNSEIPAVDVQTTEPVIIDRANIRGAGYLIRAWAGNANITVRNSRGYGITPTAWSDYKKARRFLTVSHFKNVRIENNYLENTAGIALAAMYAGNGTEAETVKIRFNKVQNIDGRIYGGRELSNFVGFNFKGGIKHAEISYNEVINHPGQSLVEDNINMYNSRGVAGNPIRIHNNYIQGAYPENPAGTSYSGGGIITDGDGDISTCPSQIEVSENQVVNAGNYSLGMAGGNNLYFHHNRVVNSARLPDGSKFAIDTAGMWSKDYYKKNTTFSNRYESNHVGVMAWGYPYNRQDISAAEDATYTNNTFFPKDREITKDDERAEYTRFLQKLRDQGVFVGPR